MKQVITKQMVEQTTTKWVAEDGKEFDEECACRRYEFKNKKDKIQFEFQKLNPITIPSPFLHEYDNEYGALLIHLTDKTDLCRFIDYCESNYPDVFSYKQFKIEEWKFPTTIILQNTDDSAWYYKPCNSLIEELKKLAKMIPQLEKAIKENEHESN